MSKFWPWLYFTPFSDTQFKILNVIIWLIDWSFQTHLDEVFSNLVAQHSSTTRVNTEQSQTQPDFSRLSKPELIEYCKKTRHRLHELEDLVTVIAKGKYTWESTFDAITEPVMIVGSDYKIERANLAMAKTAGLDITRVVEKICYQIFAGRTEPCIGCPLQSTIGNNQRSHQQLRHPIHQHDFQAHAYPFVNDKGECHSAVMYYRDMTEELRLRQEVIQQEKMAAIGMLAGGVAHEINNPLGGVLAFTQLLLQRHKEGEIAEDLQEIERSAKRCKKIVQDLLDFSRVSKEREMCLVDVNLLLEKVVPFLRIEMRSLNVDLQLELDQQLPPVPAIPDRLQQVFLNLMTNACHAMPKGGKLVLSSGSESGQGSIWIKVQDTGLGIPKEIQHRIFEPFFTTKEPGKGTGLGLSVSYRIVKEHKGSIDFVTTPGQGTTFVIRLPMTA